MAGRLDYLEGRRICVVLVQMEKAGSGEGTIPLKCLYGRGNVERGRLFVEGKHGRFEVPGSACNRILPSDNTELLKDSEYFVMCGVSGMEL